MNLFLRPLENPNNVTWSVVWCLTVFLFGVLFYVINIFKIAYKELNNERYDSSQQEELLQLQSDQDQQSS